MADEQQSRFSEWWRDSPLNLAVFRITVACVWLYVGELRSAAAWAAALPDEIKTAPIGLGWTMSWLPMTPDVASALYCVSLAATVTGLLGLFSRTSFLIVTVTTTYLLAIPQFAGSVFHYHHLVWFSALLAVSPCGDSLSIDAWFKRRRGLPTATGRSLAYGVPIRTAWILIGLIFFFPGLWKLITSGAAWFWSDNLRNQMWAKWLQNDDFVPLFRIDHYPVLLRVGALLTVLFELGFIVAIPFRRIRLYAVGAACTFHLLTAYFMNLHFPALWLCYPVFLDHEHLWARFLEKREPIPDARNRPWKPSAAVAAFIVLGAGGFGALGISDSWPFACYPKFDRMARARMPALEVELVFPDGSTSELPATAYAPRGRTPRYWALTWSLMGAHERDRASRERFEAFWESVSHREAVQSAAESAREVRFYRTYISTDPDRQDEPPESRRELASLPVFYSEPAAEH